MDEGADEFYIVDLRGSFRGNPFVIVWRRENGGYAYPLSWGGRYTRDEIEAQRSYYTARKEGRAKSPDRFPVACYLVETIAFAPPPGMIDGNAGPVVRNNDANRRRLRRWRDRSLAALLSHEPERKS